MRQIVFWMMMGVGFSASALEPTTTALVDELTLSVPSTFLAEENTAYVGITECERMLAAGSEVNITFGTTIDPSEESGTQRRLEAGYLFEVPRGSTSPVTCPSGCTTLDEDTQVVVTTELVRLLMPFKDMVGIASADECDGFDSEFFLRASLREASVTDTELVTADARIIVDTVRPSPPANFDITVTEDRIDASWELSDSEDVGQYGIYYSTTPFDGGVVPGSGLGSEFVTAAGGRTSASFVVSTPAGSTVYVAMVAVDETGNESILSAVQSSQAIETIDFWESYKAAGGAEEGGCSTGAGTFGLLSLLALFGFRRRRFSAPLAAAAIAAPLLLAAPSVHAESDINGIFELKLGSMYPAIDDEVSGTPFQDVFGTGNLWYLEMEAGFYFWQGFGKLGVSYALGYSSVTGNAVAADGSEISDETSFSMLPNRLSLLYRFDVLATRYFIPLVPAAKVGLDYYLWWSEGPDGENSVAGGAEAFGGKWGYHGSIGLHFLLDVIDSSSAAVFDHNWGVNNSYLFAEYVLAQVDDFGGAGLNLSDDYFMFGLNFEF